MVSFKHYFILSVLLTCAYLSHAWTARRQFYNWSMYMANHKLGVVIMGNVAFLLLVLFGKTLKWIFLGTLTRDEIEDLVQNSKYTITETMLALTIFREELNMRLVVLFTCLLFMKIFHWLAAMRVESMARSQGISRWSHIRLLALLAFLALVDWTFVIVIGIQLIKSRTPDVLLLFGFEYMILSVALASTFFKYVIHALDARWEARGQHWPAKTSWMFYLEFTADLVRLTLYLIFFLIICTHYGLPLHLIRELGITFYTLRERVIKFIHFRKITKNMNERFPDATAEELNQGDKTCIVCREDMEVGQTKKLPCSHMFHFNCLRTWLERSQSCPTCRAAIPANAPVPPVPGVAPNNQNNNAAAAPPPAQPHQPAAGQPDQAQAQAQPAAGLGAGAGGNIEMVPLPPGLPPLPPHLQAHLDVLRQAAAQAQQELAAAVASPPPAAQSATTAGATVPAGASSTLPHNVSHSAPPPHHSIYNPVGGIPPFNAFPHQLNAFMFPPPPPPPPPPAHLFPPGMMSMPPMAMPMPPPLVSPITAYPSDPLFGAYLQHHTMLLNHHAEFLASSLAQVKILIEQQKTMAEQFEAQMKEKEKEKESVGKKDGKSSPTPMPSPIGRAMTPPANTDTDDVIEAKEDGATKAADSTLTQRRPHGSQ